MKIKLSNYKSGIYRKGDKYQYFLPNAIHVSYELDDKSLLPLIEQASLKLGELNSFAQLVPNIDLFIHSLVAKEAVKSNSIEGTQTNIAEALSEELHVEPERRDDWREVQQYIKAMNKSIQALNKLPLSTRLIKDAHKILLSGVRGTHKLPGEFRLSQNWIGGVTLKDAMFIPPHHQHVPELMSDLEKFLNDYELEIPHLVKIGIAHYQFETIHPFLDGNGRMGRLLITLYLVSNNILNKPLLYLSDFFDQHRQLYYDNLTKVREKHDMCQWLKFFLIGIIETATKSVSVLHQVLHIKESVMQDRLPTLGRKFKDAQILLEHLFINPVLNGQDIQKILDLSPKAANDMIKDFIELEILTEISGYKRNRIFAFSEYLDILRG
jgi:Fic family protein